MSDLEREAMRAATVAARKIIAQSKNPRTILGRMSPTSVAFHAAWAAIRAHDDYLDAHTFPRPGGVPAAQRAIERLVSQLPDPGRPVRSPWQ